MFKHHWLFFSTLLLGVVLTVPQLYYFDFLDKVAMISFTTELIVMLTSLIGILLLKRTGVTKVELIPISTGLVALFIAQLMDVLDEVLAQPEMITFLFEDMFWLVGYLFLIYGLIKFVSNSRN